jgi:hypothetical protein
MESPSAQGLERGIGVPEDSVVLFRELTAIIEPLSTNRVETPGLVRRMRLRKPSMFTERIMTVPTIPMPI